MEDELLYYDASDFSSPSSSNTCSSFESSSSDMTDASSVVSSCSDFFKPTDYSSPMPPLTLAFEDSLSFDMLQLYEKLLPSRDSYNKRQLVISKIKGMLHREWPDQHIEVHLFGSSENDLGTDLSDVDICISTTWTGLRCIKTLAAVLKKNGLQVLRTIPRAKVPIVKVWDPELHLACDLNVNNTLALQNTKMIKTYVAIDSRVRPLALIIKHWTKQRSINDAADGGTLSTYSWTCMIINFLQTREPPILPKLHEIPHDLSLDNIVMDGLNTSFFSDADSLQDFGKDNHETLGGLFYAFFRKYGFEFDYKNQVISVRSGNLLSKVEKGWHKGIESQRLLCIEEPFDVRRNLGNSSDEVSVKGLQREFQRVVHLLLETQDLDDVCALYHPPRPSPPTTSSTSTYYHYSTSSSSSAHQHHPIQQQQQQQYHQSHIKHITAQHNTYPITSINHTNNNYSHNNKNNSNKYNKHSNNNSNNNKNTVTATTMLRYPPAAVSPHRSPAPVPYYIIYANPTLNSSYYVPVYLLPNQQQQLKQQSPPPSSSSSTTTVTSGQQCSVPTLSTERNKSRRSHHSADYQQRKDHHQTLTDRTNKKKNSNNSNSSSNNNSKQKKKNHYYNYHQKKKLEKAS